VRLGAASGTPLAFLVGRPAAPNLRLKTTLKSGDHTVETLLQVTPAFAAIGYSIVYLLAGGGVFGAFVIFVVAKMLGR
jgi:ethanolamine utilization microcompartment shell protein EutL